MSKLILLRHGQSQWNRENLFTGWVDVPLTPTGIEEALAAGSKFAEVAIDYMFCSSQLRAQQTALLAMSRHPCNKIPTRVSDNPWQQINNPDLVSNSIPMFTDDSLNERYYGELQGMDKDTARAKFGAEQVHIWRRSFDNPPPGGESMQDTMQRVWPYFENNILTKLAAGKNCLVTAHGNSLRTIIMQIENINEQDILNLEVATGQPMIYEYDTAAASFTKTK